MPSPSAAPKGAIKTWCSQDRSQPCLRIFDNYFQREKLILGPGDYAVSNEDILLHTVLGSCVAVTLYDPVRKNAGMNHYLLAEAPSHRKALSQEPNPRFGRDAISLLVEAMVAHGSGLKNLQAKIFGGGRILQLANQNPGGLWIDNATIAHDCLGKLGIPIKAHDTGGTAARRVVLKVHTGEVFVQKLHQ